MHERGAAEGYFKNRPTLLIIAGNGRHFWDVSKKETLFCCHVVGGLMLCYSTHAGLGWHRFLGTGERNPAKDCGEPQKTENREGNPGNHKYRV